MLILAGEAEVGAAPKELLVSTVSRCEGITKILG